MLNYNAGADQTGTPATPGSVATPSPQYKIMERDRTLPNLLLQGVDAIRDASRNPLGQAINYPGPEAAAARNTQSHGFVVQHEAETAKGFGVRLELLRFYSFYWRACNNLGAMPFTKPISWSKETPQEVQDWENNIETTQAMTGAAGRDLRSFARDSCSNVAGMGLGALFANLLDGADRPYIQFVPGSSILDVISRTSGTASRPMRIKLKICGRAPGAPGLVDARGIPWSSTQFDRLMVIYDGDPAAAGSGDDAFAGYEIYDQEEPGKPNSPWKTKPTEALTPMRPQRAIPMVPLAAGYDGPWFSRPMLRQIAQAERVWINMRSDLDYILKTSCVPMWDWAGATEEDEQKHGVISPSNVWRSENPAAHLRPAEFAGTSMQVAASEIENLLREIEAGSMAPFLNRPTGNETATGKAIDSAQALVVAQACAISWADSFSQAIQFAAIYAKVPDKVIQGIYVTFHHDFGISINDIQLATLITQAYIAGKVEPERWFIEMKRLGGFSDDLDPAAAAKWVLDAEKQSMDQLMGRQAALLSAHAAGAAGQPPPGGAGKGGKPPVVEGLPPNANPKQPVPGGGRAQSENAGGAGS